MDLNKSHKERGQGYKRDLAKPQFFLSSKKIELRPTRAQVHQHVVI
jgi:hypothetical protein